MPLILAVDDENVGLYFRRLILEQAGYAVLSATSVSEALQLFHSNPVDLVVTDHLLGREVGTEMARQMKQAKPSVPIVLLSGTSSVPEPLQYADAFLSKTEGPRELLALIQQVLPATDVRSTLAPDPSVHDTAVLPQLLAAIVEDTDDAIFSKTLQGTILTWNKAAQAMYGYHASEVIGQNVSILLPPERRDEVEHILRRLQAGERIHHFETVRRTKDGRILHASLTISPVRDADGNIIAASTIARDVSHLKQAEEALRNSERLAVAGRMAATIAHEINNPIETATNILYLLARNPSLDDAAREWVKTADQELHRVGQITRTTLGFYRERDSAVAPVNLAELLQSILNLYQRRLQSIGLHVDMRFETAATVPGIAGELRQVFTNLIANAIDALTIAGTRLVIRLYNSTDWRDLARRGVRVSIADDGPGMSATILANLFQPFYTTKGQQGTGLGLWVSRGIVSTHSGSIRVRSATGLRHGTCFSVFLPATISRPQST